MSPAKTGHLECTLNWLRVLPQQLESSYLVNLLPNVPQSTGNVWKWDFFRSTFKNLGCELYLLTGCGTPNRDQAKPQMMCADFHCSSVLRGRGRFVAGAREGLPRLARMQAELTSLWQAPIPCSWGGAIRRSIWVWILLSQTGKVGVRKGGRNGFKHSPCGE